MIFNRTAVLLLLLCLPIFGQRSVDSQGRVTTGNASTDKILGPMLADGVGPWTWFDNRHKALATFFGGLQATDAGYADDWNTALAGTVAVASGGSTVLGVSTTFQTDFCSGGTTPDSEVAIVVWYPVSGGTGRVPFSVRECVSQTEITMWDTAAFSVSAGANYGKLAFAGNWHSGSTNNNYYDNVLAFYSAYYRTGTTAYLTYARTLADRWWSSPFIDHCRPEKNGWGAGIPPPRVMSLTGLVLRALDGQPGMWADLEGCFDYYAGNLSSRTTIYDVREQAYNVSAVALGALLDPDSGKRAAYVAALENAIADNWGPNQQAHGNWHNPTYGYATWNGYSGTVTVTHGSTTVTSSGASWSATFCGGESCNGWPFWLPEDPVTYTTTYVSPTEVTLSRPYEGTTRSGAGYQWSNLVGNGTQPFQMGIAGRAWYWAYQALLAAGSGSAPAARQFVLDTADWITDYGYSPTVKGLYYGVDYPNCPTPDTSPGCTADASRYTNGEVIGTYSAAYALTGDSKYKTQGDKLFGAVWGGPSSVGPYADGTYPGDYLDGEVAAYKKAKNFGFGFGFGGSTTWPAARLNNTAALPMPQVTFPSYLPVNGSIGINNYAAYAPINVSFAWSFTPANVSSGGVGALSSVARAAAAAQFKTAGPSASFAGAGLSPGYYQVTVQAVGSQDNTSPTATGFVTLVQADLNTVRVYPNPWRADKHSGKSVVFSGLTLDSTVKIFTVSGHLVRTLSNVQVNGTTAIIPWDLINDSGDKVASGIYMYLITDGQGNKAKGKVAVIR